MDQKSPGRESSATSSFPQKSILHRPIDTVREVLQRISSHDATQMTDRGRSYVTFQDAELESHHDHVIDKLKDEDDSHIRRSHANNQKKKKYCARRP